MRRAFRFRLRLLSAAIAGLSLLLVVRLYFVQVVHGEEFALRAERQYVHASQDLFNRGTIYFTSKDGTLVSAASLSTGFQIAMDPGRIGDASAAEAAFIALAEHLPGLDKEEFIADTERKDDTYEVVATKVSEDIGRAIDALEIPGIIVERQRWRAYPAGKSAAQSVGFIAFDNDNTLAGRLGLERYYEDVLAHGGEGIFGNFFAELFANIGSALDDPRQAREGSVVTGIEPVVQKKLDQVLKEVNDRYGSAETGGIIMDPKTGAIVALGTYPTFDPNSFGTEDSQYFGNPLVESRYEFGSIIKALTMAAGLDAGVITPQTSYADTGCMTLNSKTICNYDLKARGVVAMPEVLKQSLNMGTTFISQRLGHQRMREYFTELGLGTETGIDLPSEIRGDIRNLESPRDIEHATASFGQGIAMTPVQAVRALGTLANSGKAVTPHVANAIKLESGVTKTLSWGEPVEVFSPQAVEGTTRMLVEVVDEKLSGGTVKIPEMSVAAKTGTAQIAGPGGAYLEDRYFHSFFGYFPAYEPRYIILLYTKSPGGVQYASETLTSPFMDLTHFLINYYEIPPDRVPE